MPGGRSADWNTEISRKLQMWLRDVTMLPCTALTGSRGGCRSPRRRAGRWWPCPAAPQLLSLPRTLEARCSCWATRKILRPAGTWSVASSPASRDVQCQGLLSTHIGRCHCVCGEIISSALPELVTDCGHSIATDMYYSLPYGAEFFLRS